MLLIIQLECGIGRSLESVMQTVEMWTLLVFTSLGLRGLGSAVSPTNWVSQQLPNLSVYRNHLARVGRACKLQLRVPHPQGFWFNRSGVCPGLWMLSVIPSGPNVMLLRSYCHGTFFDVMETESPGLQCGWVASLWYRICPGLCVRRNISKCLHGSGSAFHPWMGIAGWDESSGF